MAISFDKALGIHEQALHLRAKRSEVLASNLVNADTPGYQARDLDFQKLLNQASREQGNLGLSTSRQGHIQSHSVSTSGGQNELLYRVPNQPSQDGNTVEAHIEKKAFTENALRYQTTLTFLNGRFAGMKSALTGGR